MTTELVIVPGQHIAFLCGNVTYPPNVSMVNDMKSKIGNGSIHVGTQLESNFAQVGTSSLDVVVSRSPSPQEHTMNLFFEVFRVLRGDGVFACYEPLENRTFQDSEKLRTNLTLAGFLNPTITASGAFIQVIAKKPAWEQGTKQLIKIKKKTTAPPPQQPPAQWKMDTSADLMDEDDLVNDVDLIKPDMEQIRADCGAGKNAGGRACKNCTCGRAEQEAKEKEEGGPKKTKLTLAMLENPGIDSSCGNCALGDAFRCSGCPYRGLPVFKPGEKISLPEDFFVDDTMIS
jgi:hypothetical protein